MKTTRKSLRIGMVFVVALGIMGMIIASMRTSTVFAAAGSGSNLGGQCAPAGKTIYWDTCYGATWRYYSIGQSSQTFVGGVATATPTVAGTDNAPGGTISGCEDVGGYYILGLEVYNPQNMQSYGYQKGIVKSTNLAVNGGTYAFREVPGSDSLDTVAYKFALAEAAGATNGYTWDSNLGWFCYSPEFEYKDTEGSVQSSSGVEVKAQGGDITPHVLESEKDGHATLKISTDQSSVLVDFFHKIHYNGQQVPETYMIMLGSDGARNGVKVVWLTTLLLAGPTILMGPWTIATRKSLERRAIESLLNLAKQLHIVKELPTILKTLKCAEYQLRIATAVSYIIIILKLVGAATVILRLVLKLPARSPQPTIQSPIYTLVLV